MARILVASMPFAGHAGVLAAITAELSGRGHDVVAYTGAKYRERFSAEWLPFTAVADFDDANLADAFPRIGNGKGFRSDRANMEDVLFGTAAGQLADLLAAAHRRPFDVLVTDQLAFGAAVAGEALGIPWVTVSVSPLTMTSRDLPPVFLPLAAAGGRWGRTRNAALRPIGGLVYRRMVDPMVNQLRSTAGLRPAPPGRLFDGLYSPHLVLAQGVPGLDYPRGDLPPYVYYVGRLVPAAAPDAELPGWWADVVAARAAGRPVVHVTQGTLDVDPADLLRPALSALAGEPVLVVCTTGGAPPSVLEPLPANARAASFVPHEALMPVVDAVVTNGGWGGVLAAVNAGVPLVVAPGGLDKPEVARRVAWSGAGRNLRRRKPRPSRIRSAVREVVIRPGYRRRAAELAEALDAAGGARRAATLVEDLLTARPPSSG
ncbi:MAG TPA: glycosyltransferase [Actinoplanes sp.]